ncbi:MAG: PatA/PatG family cyanobactin maturation protease [Acidobacteriota bacterium]
MHETFPAPTLRPSDAARPADSRATYRPADLPGLRELWDETKGDSSVSIAVLDGPVDTTHPCFGDKQLKVLPSFMPKTGPSRHGTHVASLLFGQPGTSVHGVAPNCHGLVLPVFTQLDDGRLKSCSQQDLARSVTQAVQAGARVINISGGELSSSGQAIDFLRDAVRQAIGENVLIVAATGNDGCDCLHVPAALPNVLPVGALDLDQRPLGSSNWHDDLEGLMAPGASIEGAVPGGDVGLMDGTSFATPLVAGVAALLLSLQIRHGLEPDAAAVRRALLDSATPCALPSSTECRRLLRGTLNVAGARELVLRAVRAAGRPQLSSPTNPSATQGDAMTETASPGVQPHELDAAPPEAPAPAAVTPSDDVQKDQTAQSAQPQVAPSCAGGCSRTPSDAATAATDGALVAPSQSQSLVAPSQALAAPSTPTSSLILPATQPTATLGSSLSTPGLVTPSVVNPSAVAPSCQNRSLFSPFPPGQKVFSIGKLYYDFGTEARRDYFIAQIRAQFLEQGREDFNQGLVYNPDVMYRYLFRLSQDPNVDPEPKPLEPTNQDAASGLLWTLYIDQDPVYALIPEDQSALLSFFRLTTFLEDQINSKDPLSYRVAMSGVITGNTTLFNGTTVPTMSIIARGMYNWDIKSLSGDQETAAEPTDGSPNVTESDGDTGIAEKVDDEVRKFLLRIYDELRNLGVSAEDRAKNFAATNAYQARQAFKWAEKNKYKLDKISTSRSPICRRNSDCWDIKLIFFYPKDVYGRAREVFEYTIDVSDLIPVQVGELRQYSIYGSPQG